jgi:hypothetical protein
LKGSENQQVNYSRKGQQQLLGTKKQALCCIPTKPFILKTRIPVTKITNAKSDQEIALKTIVALPNNSIINWQYQEQDINAITTSTSIINPKLH